MAIFPSFVPHRLHAAYLTSSLNFLSIWYNLSGICLYVCSSLATRSVITCTSEHIPPHPYTSVNHNPVKLRCKPQRRVIPQHPYTLILSARPRAELAPFLKRMRSTHMKKYSTVKSCISAISDRPLTNMHMCELIYIVATNHQILTS